MARAIKNCQHCVLVVVARKNRGESHTVNLHLAVCGDGLNQALLLEVGDALAGERPVDLHAVDENSDGNQAVGLDILEELLRGALVEDDGVLGLVLDLALRPLLLLLLSSSSRRLQQENRLLVHCSRVFSSFRRASSLEAGAGVPF